MQDQWKSDKLVSTAWLADNLDNPTIRIIDVGDRKNPQAYDEGHIPGALHWPWKESLWDATTREFLLPKDFSRLMEKSGIGHDTTVIFYSNSCQFAHYAFWICEMRGYTKAKILHGNRTLWIKEKRPLTQEVPQVKPASYPVRPTDESSRIGREGILAGLNNPDRVLLDVRSPEEFMGERVSPKWFGPDYGAERKGHIPGAQYLFYAELINEDETFKSLKELRESFYKRGATPDKEIVFYCRMSHRASMVWFVARYLLGYTRRKVYDGSWTEWGNLVGVPIVNESLAKEPVK